MSRRLNDYGAVHDLKHQAYVFDFQRTTSTFDQNLETDMSVKLRLSRGGTKKRPYYYIVATNSTAPRDGRYIEQIGTFNPLLKKDDPERIKLDLDRAKHWLTVGAQPTDRVARFLDAAGLVKRTPKKSLLKSKPKKKALERAAAKAGTKAAA
jgi:small subunit ribosomal protein S16